MFSDFAAQLWKVGFYELDGALNQPIHRCILGSFFAPCGFTIFAFQGELK